jgi:hypothetical protein
LGRHKIAANGTVRTVNLLIFNTTAENLKATIYGVDANEPKPIAVDPNGLFLFSPLSEITVAADALDIRSLSSARDSVVVTATDLDIRALNGTQDSVQLYNRGFVEETVSTTVPAGTNFLLTRDISGYRENSYFIRNNGSSTITVTLQVAPLDSSTYYVDNSTAQGVTAGSNNITSVTVAMKFARLRVVASTNTNVVAFYNGRA